MGILIHIMEFFKCLICNIHKLDLKFNLPRAGLNWNIRKSDACPVPLWVRVNGSLLYNDYCDYIQFYNVSKHFLKYANESVIFLFDLYYLQAIFLIS